MTTMKRCGGSRVSIPPAAAFRRSLGVAAAMAVVLSLTAAGVQAQGKWPERPIRLMTPFAPGGGSDILARALSPAVSEAIGQTIVVDNRPGGGGTLGAGMIAAGGPPEQFRERIRSDVDQWKKLVRETNLVIKK